MQTVSVKDAVAMIPDGATLMIGGFMGVGTPERLIDELVRQGKRDLTVIANDTACRAAASASWSMPGWSRAPSRATSASIPRRSGR